MPKQKTHSGAKKRFKVTGSGKITHEQANRRHLLEGKRSKRTRKLMDYGKFKYEAAQKARESRRNQTNTIIKEMKLRPKIDQHDYDTKKGHVVRFLRAGDKVKITIMFRGREQSRPELGLRLLATLAEDVEDLGFVEAAPKQDGRNMIMVLAPHRTKSSSGKAAAAPEDESIAAEA